VTPDSDLSARVRSQRGGPPLGAIVAIVIAVALLVWLLFLRGDDDGDEPEQSAAGPAATKTVELVSAEDLPGAVADVGYPVYWLGPQGDTQYELTVITDGRTYVRYLPTDEEPGTTNAYPTVGSYAQAGAVEVLERLSKRQGSETIPLGGGAVALEGGDDTSVYLAYPGQDTQIELFDPEPGRALQQARAGAVVPLG
jgi:hypothetical protein